MSRRDEITDDEIQELINMPKIIREHELRKVKLIKTNGYIRFNIEASADLNRGNSLYIFYRVLVEDSRDFSVGLRVKFNDGSDLNLMRCNGIHGVHRNKIEHVTLNGRHIHIATERYIRKGFDAEGFAVDAENQYNDPDSAFLYLAQKCNIRIEGFELFSLENLRGVKSYV